MYYNIYEVLSVCKYPSLHDLSNIVFYLFIYLLYIILIHDIYHILISFFILYFQLKI